MERWIPIDGYEGLYLISNYGRVKKITQHWWGPSERVLISNMGGRYRQVRLTAFDGSKKYFSLHRIVASHFVSNPNGKPIVNHKDGKKRNNHFSNLEWCTQKENVAHAKATGLTPNRSKVTHQQIKALGDMGFNHTQIAALLSVSKQTIIRNKKPATA